MVTRNYSSVYSVKDFSLNTIAPKFFDIDEINTMNVGLMGYVTDLTSTVTEDTFNAISTHIREIFPNLAQMPETLYNHASMLDVEDLFAVPAKMGIILFVNEQDIILNGVENNGRLLFTLDSQLTINIGDKQFMLDYDVIISAKPFGTDYNFTASYDFNFQASVSNIINPYIKVKRIKLNGTNYLGLIVDVHQMSRFEHSESIVNNNKINLPRIPFTFSDQLANFDVFYRTPDSQVFTQLKKKLFGSTPLREPFCFYKIKDDNTVELSFTLRDNYFQPAFNSEILIKYYTTNGVEGNFPLYQGTDVVVMTQSDMYDYNNNISLYAIPQTESMGGKNKITREELRNIIIERSSTSGAYNVESDLQLYFSNYAHRDKNEVLFIKKRDDVLERLFSAFALFKDVNENYYPTNTLNLQLFPDDFDIEYEQSTKFILKAGHVFRYKKGINDTLQVIPDLTIQDDLTDLDEDFLYTNPFLISIGKSPSIIGFYLNSVDDRIPLEYSYVNDNSPMQFICNNVSIKRNSLNGEDAYVIQVVIMPTSDLPIDIVDEDLKDLSIVKLALVIEDELMEVCFNTFDLVNADVEAGLYTFQTTLETDDYMTFGQRMRVLNTKELEKGQPEVKLIPMNECKVNIYTFFKYPDLKLEHKYDNLDEFKEYSMTNMYSTEDTRANFIVPMDIMRSQVKYLPNEVIREAGVVEKSYSMMVSFVPFLQAESAKDVAQFSNFLNLLYAQYRYLMGAINRITNNFGVDMKFYNTFGRSKNFVVGEDGTILDKVNITIRFKIAPNIGAIVDELVRDVKVFIKEYIENINGSGYNSIYISNLLRAIETNFIEVKYMKFLGINEYDSSVQSIENRGLNIDLLTKDERQGYIPEYLTVSLDNIIIDIIR